MIEVEEQNTTDSASRDVAVNELASHLGVRAERGRRFAELTSLRVGGAIDWVLSPQTEEQAAALVHELEQKEIAWRPLGSGSNVLADDGAHHYVILSVKDLKADPVFSGAWVSVSAGYSLPRLCIDSGRRGLSGIEGLSGIPGTVGGALWMNAGAFGQEIGTVVETVRVARAGRVVEIPGSEVKWNYRHTSFRKASYFWARRWFCIRATPKKFARAWKKPRVNAWRHSRTARAPPVVSSRIHPRVRSAPAR